MENQRTNIKDMPEILKILDGESKTFVFLNEGEMTSHIEYGDAVLFDVEYQSKKMRFYVKINNYSLLKQIKLLDSLTGLLVNLVRVGSNKSDTRYTINKVPLKE